MFKTRVTEMLGIQYPIIAGGMQLLSRAELVAAVSNAGGLGIITSLTFDNMDSFRQELRKCKSLTKKPFAVNINLFPTTRPVQNEEFIRVMAEEGVKVVETSGRSPAALMPKLKEAGITVIHKVARVRDATSAERAGVDMISIVGFECGGHPSLEEVTTLILVPMAVESVKIPVIAGGGIADARGFLAALALGAEGVVMGTRFMMTKECPAHPKLKQALIEAKESDTALLQKSIQTPIRAWKNKLALQVLEKEAKGATLEELLPLISGQRGSKAYLEGEVDEGEIACGQAIGLIRDVISVQEVMDRVINGARAILDRLNRVAAA